MKKKLLFALILVLLLTPWQAVFASAATNGVLTRDMVQIEAASPEATPLWQAFGSSIGGVTTPGDLFYIDATNNPVPIRLTLHFTNAHELRHCYSYLILEVGVYVEGEAGEWERASFQDGGLISDTFITLENGQASLALKGNANYKVTIDGGSFYCITTNQGSPSPKFHLTAQPA